MKKTRALFLFLLVVMLAVGGCTSQTATPAPATSTPVPTSTTAPASTTTELSLVVDGKTLSAAELDALPRIDVEAEGAQYTGIRILDVLDAAGVSGAETISLVASDGYAAELLVANLDEQSIFALDADGTFDTVLPGQDTGGWVRDTIEIVVVAGGAETGGAEEAILTVAGKGFSMSDLEALGTIDVEVEGTQYSGIRILDLLDAAGASGAETISLVASDVATPAKWSWPDLTDDCILALDADGTLDGVLPELSKGGWVKDTVEITVVAGDAEDAALTVAGKGFSMSDWKLWEPSTWRRRARSTPAFAYSIYWTRPALLAPRRSRWWQAMATRPTCRWQTWTINPFWRWTSTARSIRCCPARTKVAGCAIRWRSPRRPERRKWRS